MPATSPSASATIVGRRMRARREGLGWPQERVGVAIGIEESTARVRISRYEGGVHEPPVATARLIADALGVPLAHLYCEQDNIAALLLALHKQPLKIQEEAAERFIAELSQAG
ncbi:transcriptional regulator with XRE-family HTH domain [Acidovorax soli]|uniref:Transcriptional regulator with XRE-family HTH domain n=1 Tax=Acidovorax soli TaxID=592050 RepID=A0A7X0PIE3_9BURK|nr:helix-turn-helix transcriptional regulator [Acidovorax soli]MBB6562505.1 transcriptional regulator with XRE-family HTH domain [Acidovorax soli]